MSTGLVADPTVSRDQFYRKPTFRQAPREATINLITRIAYGLILGIFLYCVAAVPWYVITQMITPVHTAMHAHLSTLTQHGIRDGALEYFFALSGVAIAFAKKPKEHGLNEVKPLRYRILCSLRFPNAWQGRPMSVRQLKWSPLTWYLSASIGLVVGVIIYANIGTWWHDLGQYGHMGAHLTTGVAAITSTPVLGFVWNFVLGQAPKKIPALLGVLFFGYTVSGFVAWNLQAAIVETLVAKGMNFDKLYIPGSIRDQAGDIQYKRAFTGREVNTHGHLFEALVVLGGFLLLMGGFGACIVFVIAKLKLAS